MIKLFSPSLRLGLAPSGAALLSAGAWRGPDRLVAEQAFGGAAEAVVAAEHGAALLAAAGCPGRPLTVVLADRWVRFFLVTPPKNSLRPRDCEAAAALRFQTLYGEAPAAWRIEADWQARDAFLACAVPRAMMETLEQAAAAERCTLVSVLPQFVAAWNDWCRKLVPKAWLGVLQEDGLTLGAVEQGRLRAVRALALPSGRRSHGWLRAQLTREALRLNLAVPDQLFLAGGGLDDSAEDSVFAQGALSVRELGRDADASASPAVVLARSGMRA